MKKMALFLAIFTFLAAMPVTFAAQGETIWEMANSDQYGKKAGGMFGRGLLNAATCFVDVIVQTVNGTQDGPPFVGTLTGLGGGIACTALRATSGVLDVGTFWVPGFNGIPVSKDYANCLDLEEEAPAAESYVAPVASPTPVVEQPVAAKHDALEYVKK